MTARPAKERTVKETATVTTAETVHYESIEDLVQSAVHQDAYAADARKNAALMAEEMETLNNRLVDLRPRLAAAQRAAMDCERRAADFRVMAADYCKANGWPLPAPKTADPVETAPGGAVVDAAVAALAEQPDAKEAADDA